MIKDPPLRKDGRCAQCGGERKMPKARSRAEAAVDPFCSASCCRVWHQTEVITPTGGRPRTSYGKRWGRVETA